MKATTATHHVAKIFQSRKSIGRTQVLHSDLQVFEQKLGMKTCLGTWGQSKNSQSLSSMTINCCCVCGTFLLVIGGRTRFEAFALDAKAGAADGPDPGSMEGLAICAGVWTDREMIR